MTKATLLEKKKKIHILFHLKFQTMTPVADCAHSPWCPFLRVIVSPFPESFEIKGRNGRAEGSVGDIVFHFSEKSVANICIIQLPLALKVCIQTAFQK